jgi:hypothetical protein
MKTNPKPSSFVYEEHDEEARDYNFTLSRLHEIQVKRSMQYLP